MTNDAEKKVFNRSAEAVLSLGFFTQSLIKVDLHSLLNKRDLTHGLTSCHHVIAGLC